MPRRPTFFIIGAMKSGTTSFHAALAAHPQVFMTTPKELHYFVEDRNWSRGIEWYERQFAAANGATALGEASATYTQMPFRGGVAERMAALVPDARIIYLVRHPVERMLSHYRHALSVGSESRPPAAAFGRRDNYAAFSHYPMQLEPYLEHFGRDQLLVLQAERYFAAPADVVREACAFIGVDPALASDKAQHVNRTADKDAPTAAVRRLRTMPGADTVLRHLPVSVRHKMKKAAPRRSIGDQRFSVPDDLRAELEEQFRPDAVALRGFVQGPFDGWGLDQ